MHQEPAEYFSHESILRVHGTKNIGELEEIILACMDLREIKKAQQ